jgi:RsiW-degrading membrane proteinase PrsW (M82 family)
MEFYVQKDGQQYGPLTSTALQEHLQAGTFSLTDLVWDQAKPQWIPIEELLRLQSERQSKILSRGIAYLQCVSGPDLGKRVQLAENQPVIIGTSPDSNVLSDDSDALPHHIQVTVSQRKVTAQALEGAGLYLDGLHFTSGIIGTKQQLRIGRSLWQVEVPRDFKAGAGAMIGNMADRISSAAGLEQLQDFRAGNIFSAVFQKRTQEDFEVHFAAGSPSTTPTLSEIDTRWPQPWVFFRALMLSLGAFVGFYYACSHFENPKLIPGVILVGAFAVPLSVLVLFFEFNAPRNVSLYQMIRVMLIGGMFSLLITMFLYRWLESIGLSWMGASVAGIVEESAKLLALLMVVGNPRYPWSLNGMLFGACVGTSFAVIETAGYAFESLFSGYSNGVEITLLVRGVATPLGGHAILTAMVGAALWRVKGTSPFKIEMLRDSRFLRVFLTAVILHTVWNSPLQFPFLGDLVGSLGKYVVIGFIAWVVVLSLVQMGLKEIREAQPSPTHVPETEDTAGQELTVTA